MTSEPLPEAPAAVRHEYLGSSIRPSCFTGAVATANGLATVGEYTRDSGLFAAMGDPGGSPWGSVDLSSSVGAAIVFPLPTGYAVAWSPDNGGDPTVELFTPDDEANAVLSPAVKGEPVAGVGFEDGVAIVFRGDDGTLSLWRSRHNVTDSVPIETGPCVADGAFAAGALGDDVLVAYSCHRGETGSATARPLVVARVAAGGTDVERTEAGLDVSEQPAAFFLGEGFVFAALTSNGAALVYLAPGDAAGRVVPISGLSGESNQAFSVVATDSDVLITGSSCRRHEDALPTGRVALCHVAPETGAALCSEVEAACAGATLVSTSSGIVLLPCSESGPGVVEIADPSAAPVPLDASFPQGYAEFAPLALDCDGDACTALLQLDAAEATTGFDERLGSLDIDLGSACEAKICSPVAAAKPGEPHTHSAYDVGRGGFTLESEPSGFPFGIVAGSVSSDVHYSEPQLSLVGRTGVAWTEPLTQWPDGLYATGNEFRLFTAGYAPTGLYESSASATGVADEPFLWMRLDNGAPSMARCGDRVFMHAIDSSQSSSLHAAIFALDLGTNDFAPLFDPGIYPPEYSKPSEALGCSGSDVFILDGSKIHDYALDGTRRPDIALADLAPSAVSSDPVLWQFETRNNHALLLRSTSGANAIDALFLYDNGAARSYTLPLPPQIVPLTTLVTAPDRGDGWLRAIYQGREGSLYVSAWRLDAL